MREQLLQIWDCLRISIFHPGNEPCHGPEITGQDFPHSLLIYPGLPSLLHESFPCRTLHSLPMLRNQQITTESTGTHAWQDSLCLGVLVVSSVSPRSPPRHKGTKDRKDDWVAA